MSYRGPVTIYNQHGWTLESYGNGAAYTLWHELPGGRRESCFFQGDDAATFRDEFDRYNNPIHLFQEYESVLQPEEESA